jgi:arginine/lysine/ornithine decarboxylase
MFTPQNSQEDFDKLKKAFENMGEISKNDFDGIELPKAEQVMTIRQAVFSENEEISVDDALNRVCASPTVSCPPAIPIAVSGEKITEQHIELFRKYNIDRILVIK